MLANGDGPPVRVWNIVVLKIPNRRYMDGIFCQLLHKQPVLILGTIPNIAIYVVLSHMGCRRFQCFLVAALFLSAQII